MEITLNIIFKTIFFLSILFVVLTFYSFTFGQTLPYEFADWRLSRQFYNLIMQGLPLALLLTLTGTLKRKNAKAQNIKIIVVTIIGSIVCFFIMANMLFSVGFLTITNDTLLYKHKTKPTTTIMKQTIGQGALGEDGHRIVQVESFLKFWNKTTIVDTTKLDKSDWIFVNKNIDMRNAE